MGRKEDDQKKQAATVLARIVAVGGASPAIAATASLSVQQLSEKSPDDLTDIIRRAGGDKY